MTFKTNELSIHHEFTSDDRQIGHAIIGNEILGTIREDNRITLEFRDGVRVYFTVDNMGINLTADIPDDLLYVIDNDLSNKTSKNFDTALLQVKRRRSEIVRRLEMEVARSRP